MNIPELHLLRAAVVLAEVRNYSRAAKKLGIQQPTLTKWILELEHVVGFQLFLRSTQFVEPTDACRQLVDEAKQSIFHAERAVYVARTVEQGAQTVLHVGKSQYTDPYLVSVVSSISLPLFPNLKISLSSMSSAEMEAQVLLGQLDVAIATGEFESSKITQLELMRTPFYILMPEHHDLAGYREVSLTQLDGLMWLLFERHVHPPLYEAIMKAAAAVGAKPRSLHHVITAEEAAQNLYAGNGEAAFLTQAGAWRVARNGLTMRPLHHPALNVSAKAIARANDGSRVVSEFVRMLKLKLERAHGLQLDLKLAPNTRS